MNIKQDLLYEAEQIVLALILRENKILEKVASYLTPADFIERLHRQIYEACLTLKREGKTIDLLNIKEYFTSKNIDFPYTYLVELIETPILSDISDAAKRIKENTVKRKLLAKLKNFTANLEKDFSYLTLENIDLVKLFNEVQDDVKQIKVQDWKSADKIDVDRLQIVESFPLGIKIQNGAIWGLAGATSTGKTELMIDIANAYCMESNNNVVFYGQYEGTEPDFEIRLSRKNINAKNFYYAIKPEFWQYLDFVDNFKDKNIFIVVDYLQMFGRRLKNKDKRAYEPLKTYVNSIFNFFDDIRFKYPNVSVCLLLSLSKAGITETSKDRINLRLNYLNAIKESGDVQYDLDYCYGLLFTDDMKEYHLSRLNSSGESRKKIVCAFIKGNRIGATIRDVVLEYNIENNCYLKKGTFIK